MIRIKDFSFTYPNAEKATLSHIDLQVEKGDFLAIIGNNGCGKSTFCKTLNGLIPNFIVGDIEGDMLVNQVDLSTCNVGEVAKFVGYVYQDFENQIVRPTVLDDASFACLNYAMEDYETRGRKALSMCGLEGKDHDFIWQLSGGQKHLLALAGVVALQPELLILDEPIAQLDPFHAKQTYEILRYLNEVHGKTIIVVEHHTEYIAEYCKHAILMREGEVVWKLSARDALRRIDDLQKSNIFPPQIAVASKLLQEKGVLRQDLVLPTTVEEGQVVYKNHSIKSEIKEKTQISVQAETVIGFNNVTVGYRAVKGDKKNIFSNFNLTIKKGEKIALIGSNGAGKTTMMKLMIGLLKADGGFVDLQGKSTKKMTPEEMSELISMVYQNPEEMFIHDSIYGDIAYAMKVRNIENWEQRTEKLLEIFNLTGLKNRDGRLMSGGQMRRASLAIGVALNPGILLLDEPTANLDIATRYEIMKTLEGLKDVTETVIIATHDMQLVCQWAERIIVLCKGEVIADGPREEVFENKEVIEKVGIRAPEIYQMAKTISEDARCYTIEAFVESVKEGERHVKKAV